MGVAKNLAVGGLAGLATQKKKKDSLVSGPISVGMGGAPERRSLI